MKLSSPFLTWLTLLGVAHASVAQSPIAARVTDSLLLANATQYDEYASGDTAEEQISKRASYDSAHNAFVVVRHPGEEIQPGHAPLSDPLLALKTLAANADAVVIGIPERRYSSLTRSHQFVFSDYEVAVESIFLDRTGLLAPGTQIVLSRPGGEVTVAGEKFRAIEPEFPLFRLDSRYVFFIHLDRSTGSFKVNPSDAYFIQGNQVVEARRSPKIVKGPQSLNSFSSDIEAAVVAVSPMRSRFR